jgi:hypothetical protein
LKHPRDKDVETLVRHSKNDQSGGVGLDNGKLKGFDFYKNILMESPLYSKCLLSKETCEKTLEIFLQYQGFNTTINKIRATFNSQINNIKNGNVSENSGGLHGNHLDVIVEKIKHLSDSIVDLDDLPETAYIDFQREFADICSGVQNLIIKHLVFVKYMKSVKEDVCHLDTVPKEILEFVKYHQESSIFDVYLTWCKSYSNSLISYTKEFGSLTGRISKALGISVNPIVKIKENVSLKPRKETSRQDHVNLNETLQSILKYSMNFEQKIPKDPFSSFEELKKANDSKNYDFQKKETFQNKKVGGEKEDTIDELPDLDELILHSSSSSFTSQGERQSLRSFQGKKSTVEVTREKWYYGILKKYKNQGVPRIVEDCVSYIYEKGLNHENLFSANMKSHEITNAIENYKNDPNFKITTVSDPHIVAGILKQWLESNFLAPGYTVRKLNTFLLLAKDKKAHAMKLILNDLYENNPVRYRTLKMIVELLFYLCLNCNENNTNSSNLAKAIGVLLFKGHLGIVGSAYCLEYLINNYRFLFFHFCTTPSTRWNEGDKKNKKETNQI